jgi:LPXTG-motif cell wall-anchored protein
MLRPRHVLTCALVLALLVLAIPVAAIAAGGGSAGDQQYVDPLAHTPTVHPAPTSTSGPASSAAPIDTPAATPASTVTLTSNDGLAKTSAQLPYTGYNVSLAAGLGFVLLLGGVGLRRRARRA